MSPDRAHDRNVPFDQPIAKVLNLADSSPDVIVLNRLLDANCHCFHITAGHATVSVQSFIDDDQVAYLFMYVIIVDGQPAADIDQRVLLAAHGAAIGVAAKLKQDGCYVFVCISRLRLLDEIGVFDTAGCIEEYVDTMADSDFRERSADSPSILVAHPPY